MPSSVIETPHDSRPAPAPAPGSSELKDCFLELCACSSELKRLFSNVSIHI